MAVTLSYIATRADMTRIWLAVLLMLATWLVFGWYDRYESSGPELLVGGVSAPGWEHYDDGAVMRRAGTASIRADTTGGVAGMQQVLARPSGADYLRLVIETRHRNVVRSSYRYANARVFLVQQNADDRPLWHHPHNVLNTDGSHDWQRADRVFRLDPAARSIRVAILLSRASGLLEVREISLQAVREQSGVTLFRIVLLIAWAVYLSWIVASGYREVGGGWMRVACVLLVLSILAGALLPHSTKGLFDAGWQRLSASFAVAPPPKSESPAPAVKPVLVETGLDWTRFHVSGHFLLFGLLMAALLLLQRGPALWRRVVAVAAFAGITEVLQLLSIDRDASFSDLATDAAGIFTAIVLVQGLRRWRRRSSGVS